MLTENFVSTILQASITGAGLILAVYGIIIPVFRRILDYKVDSLTRTIKEIKKKKASELLFKEESIEEAKSSLDYIEDIRKLPTYFNKGVIFSFVGYMASALLGLLWLLDLNRQFMEKFIPWVFGVACVLFTLIGCKTIKDLTDLVKIKHKELLKNAADKIDNKKGRSKK